MHRFFTQEPVYLSYNRLPVLADAVYDENAEFYMGFGVAPQHTYPGMRIRHGYIVFVKTDYLSVFLEKMLIDLPIVLVTGVSDDPPTEHAIRAILQNPNIKRWIGVNIPVRHPKLCKVPIGVIEHSRMADAYGNLTTLHASRLAWNEKADTVCVPYHKSTHADRTLASTLPRLPFTEYMRAIGSHKFVVCMRGNGLDTHRVCETLLMGSVPVILHSVLDDMYSQFPCLLVDSFESIDTSTFTWDEDKYQQFLNMFWLKPAFWQQFIDESERLKQRSLINVKCPNNVTFAWTSTSR
jgi:hypothetical protein